MRSLIAFCVSLLAMRASVAFEPPPFGPDPFAKLRALIKPEGGADRVPPQAAREWDAYVRAER